MTLAIDILNTVQEAANRRHDDQFKEEARRVMNEEYLRIARMHPWKALRSTVQLDFTGTTAGDGVLLPADMLGILRIRNDADDFEFFLVDREDADPEEDTWRAYTYRSRSADLFYSDDVIVDEGATTFTSAALTADGTDHTGRYVRFGQGTGLYLLDGAMSFSPTYYGPDISMQEVRIGPKEAESLVIMDPAENLLTDRAVDVYLWRRPTPLYRDGDEIFDSVDALLELRVLKRMPQTKVRRPVNDNEIQNELGSARKMNPTYARKSSIRDKHNSPFNFRNPIFQRRGTSAARIRPTQS